jgi:sugar fermentation stimulation protein A
MEKGSWRICQILDGSLLSYFLVQKSSLLKGLSRSEKVASTCSQQKGNIPIIVDTWFSNFAAKKAVEQEVYSLLKGYTVAKENVQVNNSRLDMLLQQGTNDFFIEVKSVTHVVNDAALFPDAPTSRGRRHLHHLIKLAEQGHNAAILFSVQRPDARILKPNRETDPEFATLLKKAIDNHVEILVYTLVFNYGKHATVEIVPNAPQFMI